MKEMDLIAKAMRRTIDRMKEHRESKGDPMSNWMDVKLDDIEVDREAGEVNIHVGQTFQGNHYFTMPLAVFEEKLREPSTEEEDAPVLRELKKIRALTDSQNNSTHTIIDTLSLMIDAYVKRLGAKPKAEAAPAKPASPPPAILEVAQHIEDVSNMGLPLVPPAMKEYLIRWVAELQAAQIEKAN